MKTERKMKVYEQSVYRYKPMPAIMLKGLWLKEYGFDSGIPITVRCDGDRLIITKSETSNTSTIG